MAVQGDGEHTHKLFEPKGISSSYSGNYPHPDDHTIRTDDDDDDDFQ